MEGKRSPPPPPSRPDIRRKKNHSLVCQRQWDVVVALKASSLQIDSTSELLRYSRIFFANRVSSPRCYHGNTSSDFEQVRWPSENHRIARVLPHAPKRETSAYEPRQTLRPIPPFKFENVSALRAFIIHFQLLTTCVATRESVNLVHPPRCQSSNQKG